ncbi:MAG: type II toxin-antitoxin system RatA family toxin [Halothiobacillaceae bacterium]|jgi:ribosome-associated toxin RatA of RatAB toxin-antitoxin module|nr:type II toxin-antitoxin system RatA family toxin [Halothiobacillaceae bacterium]MDY0049269.1 type II toxin-antitoxin system RatA family toxin [Halothiobacillaceae bacterium]
MTTTIKRVLHVPYTPNEMYTLVNAVEDYPQFLPWCVQTRVMLRSEEEVRASITLARGALRKSFTTHNRMQPGKMIEIRLVEGPFRRLSGHWLFAPAGESACVVTLEMEFEFANRLLDMAIGPVFREIVNGLVDAFQRRAEQVYGRRLG